MNGHRSSKAIWRPGRTSLGVIQGRLEWAAQANRATHKSSRRSKRQTKSRWKSWRILTRRLRPQRWRAWKTQPTIRSARRTRMKSTGGRTIFRRIGSGRMRRKEALSSQHSAPHRLVEATKTFETQSNEGSGGPGNRRDRQNVPQKIRIEVLGKLVDRLHLS